MLGKLENKILQKLGNFFTQNILLSELKIFLKNRLFQQELKNVKNWNFVFHKKNFAIEQIFLQKLKEIASKISSKLENFIKNFL